MIDVHFAVYDHGDWIERNVTVFVDGADLVPGGWREVKEGAKPIFFHSLHNVEIDELIGVLGQHLELERDK